MDENPAWNYQNAIAAGRKVVIARDCKVGRFYLSQLRGLLLCVRETDPRQSHPLMITDAEGPSLQASDGTVVQFSNHCELVDCDVSAFELVQKCPSRYTLAKLGKCKI